MTKFYQLAAVLGDTAAYKDLDTLQPAMYLAQRTADRQLYRYRLYSGYVISEEFAEDMDHLQTAGRFEDLKSEDSSESPDLTRLREALQKWLAHDPDLLQALATKDFFRTHSYGDPQSKLRWFRALPATVQEEAERYGVALSDGAAVNP